VDQEHEAEYRRQRRTIETKDSALQSALDDLARTQALLDQRNMESQAVKDALQTLETETKRVGETHTTAKFSLQLEVDRLQRDLERLEVDLARARKDLDERDNKGRDRDDVLDKLHTENRDLAAQLAAQTQARLNLSEKLDDTQSGLKNAEAETASLRARIQDLEQKLSKDQRSLMSAEAQYRDQLTERNTLLLTIYQYMDKILGVDKTPVSSLQRPIASPNSSDLFLNQKKHGQAETKPFTNFSVFHDNLITRLKALSQIQLDFDKRCKEAETRFTEKFNEMRKQMESRWRQLDKFEASVKAIAEAKSTWRKKMSARAGEIEALKVCARLIKLMASSSLTVAWTVDKYRITVAADESRPHVRWWIYHGNTLAYGPSYER
jgi:chromosome segregation ATPase